MKKNVLLEIERINKLINNDFLLEGPGGPFAKFIEELALKSPKAIKNLESIVKTVRQTGKKLTDEDINRITRDLEAAGHLTDDESEALAKVLKNDKEIRNILETSDNFYNDLKTLGNKKIDVPPGLKSLNKLASLTQTEIDEIVNKTLNNLMRNETTGIGKLYRSINNIYGPFITKLLNGEILIKSTDEFFDMVDNRLNAHLQEEVKAGRLTKEQAEKFYNEISEEIRCCSDIKNKLDDMVDNGLVIGGKKLTKKPNFGDPIQDVHINQSIVWEKYPTDITDMSTGIPRKKPDDPFKDAIDFEDAVSDMSRFKKFYLNSIEPYIRWWAKGFEIQFDEMMGATFETRRQEFLNAFQRGLEQFKIEGKIKNAAYYRDIIEKFQALPSKSNFFVPENKTIYEFMWDDFEKKAKVYFKDSPDDLQKFREFTDSLKNWKSRGDKNMSMKELIGLDKEYGGSGESFKSLEDNINNTLNFKIKDKYKEIAVTITNTIVDGVAKVFYKIMSGSFKSPAEASRYITKELRGVKSQVVRGKELRTTTVYSKSAAVRYTMNRIAMGTVAIPAAFAVIELALESQVSEKFDIKLIDRPWLQPNPNNDPSITAYNSIVGYVLYDIVTGIKLDDILRRATVKTKEQQDWVDYTLNVMPGSREEIIYWLGQSFQFIGSAGKGEDLDEAIEDTKKQAKEGWIPRELPPQGNSKVGFYNEFLSYLALPPKLRIPDDFPSFNAKLMIPRVRSSETALWVEDYRFDKKYYILKSDTQEISKRIAKGETPPAFIWNDNGTMRSINELNAEFSKNLPAMSNSDTNSEETIQKNESITKIIKKNNYGRYR